MYFLTPKNQNSLSQAEEKVYSESLYTFFKRSRLQNLFGQFGAPIAAVALTWNLANQNVLLAYLGITEFLVLLTGICFYSSWTNNRRTANGLPKYVRQLGVVRQTILGSLFWFDLHAAQDLTFVLAVLVVFCGCLLGSVITIGPFKSLAMQSLTCLFLPSALACLLLGHIEIACAVLFFIYVIAYRGVQQINLAFTELIRLRAESNLVADTLKQKVRELKKVNSDLEIEMDQRAKIEIEREKLQVELVQASRDAGKAEIATGVLHNVGNVMNSVNVTAGLMHRNLKDRLNSQLDAAVNLLSEQEDDLGGFFAKDPRAEHFLPFLKQLNKQSDDLLSEVQSLITSVEHVNSVVAAQQAYATTSALKTYCDPTQIVDAAIQISNETFKKFDIELTRDYEDVGEVLLDKQKLLQILVNLLRNAKHAIEDANPDERSINVKVDIDEDNMLLIAVSDSGIGIEPSNLDKIFQHGFSTRKKRGGHGFGLHHSACAIEEMGGTLSVDSQGKMKGAKFTIRIPAETRILHVEDQLSGEAESATTKS